MPEPLLGRYGLHVLVALGLTFLFPLLLNHLISQHDQLELAAHKVVGAFAAGELLGEFADVERQLLMRVGSLEDILRGEMGPRGFPPSAATGVLPAPTVDAVLLQKRASACQDVRDYESTTVSFDCVAILRIQPRRLAPSLTRRDRALGQWAADILMPLHRSLVSKGSSATSYPRILFTHLIVEHPGERWLVVYPAVQMAASYDYRARPWHSDVEEYASLRVSPLYHDYVTRAQTLTFGKVVEAGSALLRASVDVSLGRSPPVFGVHALNLVLSFGAFVMYWWFFETLNKRFVLFLAAGAASLVVGYVFLTLDAVFGGSWPGWQWLAEGRTFLPGAVFYLLAGWSLRRRPPGLRAFLVWWSVELSLAFLDIAVESSLYSSSLSVLSLFYFAVAVLQARHDLVGTVPKATVRDPRVLSWYLAAAYGVWAIAQFVLLAVSDEWSEVWRSVARTGSLGAIGEVLLAESSAFTVLLYAKSVAFMFTVLYLGALHGIRFHEEKAAKLSEPALRVRPDGTIVEQNPRLPATFESLRGARLQDLVQDEEDAREIEHLLRENVAVRNLRVHLGGQFGGDEFCLSIELADEEGMHVVSALHAERPTFPKVLVGSLCRDVLEFLHLLKQEMKRRNVGSPGAAPDALSGTVIERAAELEIRAADEIRAFGNGESGRKLDLSSCQRLLWSKVIAFTGEHPRFSFSRLPARVAMPSRVRISEVVLGLILDHLLEGVAQAATNYQEDDVVLSVGIVPGREDWSTLGADYVSLVLRLKPCEWMKASFEEARTREVFGLAAEISKGGVGVKVLMARYLARQFNGAVEGVPRRREFEIGIRLRYLLSTPTTLLSGNY